jgi:pimeloyl-[acyl-carrier protein] methyl ester esterase
LKTHCETLGTGPDLVLVHGWGWHADIWNEVAQNLAREFRVWLPDLPGHGRHRGVAVRGGLEEWADEVSSRVPRAAAWVGWSLGGLIALAAAEQGRASRLVLVGATPRFVQDTGWDGGLPQAWFERFSADLACDTVRTLERFASLHRAGEANDRGLLRRLRGELTRHAPPEADALRAGLTLLETSDLRERLPAVRTPALVWHGARDGIAAVAAGEYMAARLPRARFVRVDGAGHAPFLSHADEFVETVGEFLRE